MGFIIKDSFSYLIEDNLPIENLREILMEAPSIEEYNIQETSIKKITQEQNHELIVNKRSHNQRKEDKPSGRLIIDLDDHLTISDYTSIALKGLIAKTGINTEEIDFLITASKYSDYRHPFTTATVHDTMKLKESMFTFDLQGGDDLFIKSMEFCSGLLNNDRYKKGIIIYADQLYKLSKYNNENLIDNYIDLATAVLLEKDDESGIASVNYWTEGHRAKYHIIDKNGKVNCEQSFYMSGDDMQRTISSINDAYVKKTIKDAGLNVDDIKLFFINTNCNQIVSKVLLLNDIPIEKIIHDNGDRTLLSKFYPLMINHIKNLKGLKKGDYIFISSFGKGLSYGNMVIKI